jgi:hypothetical protein
MCRSAHHANISLHSLVYCCVSYSWTITILWTQSISNARRFSTRYQGYNWSAQATIVLFDFLCSTNRSAEFIVWMEHSPDEAKSVEVCELDLQKTDSGTKEIVLIFSFDQVPEVREILEKRLDIQNDPSLAIRSVYGKWFRGIHLLDDGWALANASRIFPESEESKPYWEAAWSAYLAFSEAREDIFDVLRPQYQLAAQRLGVPRSLPRVPGNPETELAELAIHFMAFYWRGKLDLDNALLRQFFAQAGDEVQADALENVGRWLWQLIESKQPPGEDIRQRLMTLWESRLQSAERNHVKGKHVREIASFRTVVPQRIFARGLGARATRPSVRGRTSGR